MLHRVVWIIVFLGTVAQMGFLSGCGAHSANNENLTATPQPQVQDSIISHEILNKAAMRLVWQNAVALKQAEQIERLIPYGDTIYVLTDQNYLFALDRVRGTFRFGITLGPKHIPVFGPEFYEKELLVISGAKLLEIDADFGTIKRTTDLPFRASCAAVRNVMYIYAGGTDKRVHALNAETAVPSFQAMADDGSAITSVTTLANTVIFTTDTGYVVNILPTEPVLSWQLKAVRGIPVPVAQDKNWVIVSSDDTNVYKLSRVTGQLMWKFHSGARLVDQAALTENYVYQYARQKGLYIIDNKSGKQIWLEPTGRAILTEIDDIAYIITWNNRIIIIDNKNVKKLGEVDFSGIRRYVTNSQESRVYVADQLGRVACIEIQQ
ncbi:MAG: PQQ-binding-like beta-propeller repeat protein [Planctomycetota bacterium]